MSRLNRRQITLFLLALLVGGGGAWLWNATTRPTWGGGQTESFFARRARQSEWASVPPSQAAKWEKLTLENAPGWYGPFAEPVQTFEAYRAQNPLRPTARRRTLVIQPLSFARQSRQNANLNELARYCEIFFQLSTRVEKPLVLPEIPSRDGAFGSQRDAGAVLKQLETRVPNDAVALLAITPDDLWNANLSFVFGLANLHNRVGVYSLARYFPRNRIPSKEDEKRAFRRACQVLNHETGHMFGLTHCVFYRCSMNGANSLADADGAPLDFCPICEKKLHWNIGYDSQKREAELEQFYARHFPNSWLRALP